MVQRSRIDSKYSRAISGSAGNMVLPKSVNCELEWKGTCQEFFQVQSLTRDQFKRDEKGLGPKNHRQNLRNLQTK